MTTETASPQRPLPTPRPRLRDLAVLCRLPAVFTAIADPIAGAAVGMGSAWNIRAIHRFDLLFMVVPLACLSAGSLYLFGMVQNDVVDADADAAVGKRRPIPEGRVGIADARSFGLMLLATGLLLALLIAAITGGYQTVLLASMLAGAICLYNRVLKETVIGPAAMGACRGLNMVLGFAAVADLVPEFDIWTIERPAIRLLFAAFAAYVAGLTLFARDETGRPRRLGLLLGLLLALTSLIVMALSISGNHVKGLSLGGLLPAGLTLGTVAITIAIRGTSAIVSREPAQIGGTIGWMILMIIPIDAAIVLSCGGGVGVASLVMLLLVPAIALKPIAMT